MAAAWNQARRNAPELAGRTEGLDVIVSAGTRLLETPFPELVAALDEALRALGPEGDVVGQ